jgi:hypothetical protein
LSEAQPKNAVVTPPQKNGNDCHTQVHAKNAKAKTLFDNLKVKKISFEKYLQILVI